MNEQAVRKTYKCKLKPTPKQERELARVLGLCRWLYNTALEQRITAYQRVRVSVSRFQQEAELKDIRAEFPDYAAIHSHILQDVLARLEKTYQAFFRRVKAGRTLAFRALSPARATLPSPTRSMAMARHWRTAFSSCRRLGISLCAGPVRWKARPRWSRSAGKRTGAMPASPAPMRLCNCFLPLARKRALTLG